MRWWKWMTFATELGQWTQLFPVHRGRQKCQPGWQLVVHLWSLPQRNIYLNTVLITTAQPHPFLTSFTTYICHHLWKVEFSSSSQENLIITGIHDTVQCLLCLSYLLWCNCVTSGKFTIKSWPWFWVNSGGFSEMIFSKVGVWKPARLQWGHQAAPAKCLQPMKRRTEVVVFPLGRHICTQHQALLHFAGIESQTSLRGICGSIKSYFSCFLKIDEKTMKR